MRNDTHSQGIERHESQILHLAHMTQFTSNQQARCVCKFRVFDLNSRQQGAQRFPQCNQLLLLHLPPSSSPVVAGPLSSSSSVLPPPRNQVGMARFKQVRTKEADCFGNGERAENIYHPGWSRCNDSDRGNWMRMKLEKPPTGTCMKQRRPLQYLAWASYKKR